MTQDDREDLVSGHQPKTAASSPKKLTANAVHLVRTAQINTLTLSQMADQKASILIGATFVVFSLSVTRLLGAEITTATIALALTAFISSLFAVLAVLPSTSAVSKDDAHFNILFFGHFTQIDEDDWTNRLIAEFEHDETLYRTMLRDIYQNGQVLHRRKYRFLGYAYRTFLGGLFITMVIYATEFALEIG